MRDYALVLAGGGGKGAYQIGVWRALRELGIERLIGAVAGTSVGALNGALFVSGEYSKSVKIWNNIEHEDILTPFETESNTDRGGFLYSLIKDINRIACIDKTGIFSRSGLSRIITENLNFKAIKKSSIPLYITLFNRRTLNAEYIKVNQNDDNGRIEKLLLASSAIPVIFGSEEIEGNTYYDGGLSDNCPIRPLYGEGFRKFIVVWLTHDADVSVLENSVRYPQAEIVNIIPSEDQGNFLSGTLDFSNSGITRRMQLGYHDAIRILCSAFGCEIPPDSNDRETKKIIAKVRQIIRKQAKTH